MSLKRKEGIRMNPTITNPEQTILDQVMPLQGKHIFTKNLGDGEINLITRKNDLSGICVYFHSNWHGEMKLDGQEFLDEVEEVKEIV